MALHILFPIIRQIEKAKSTNTSRVIKSKCEKAKKSKAISNHFGYVKFLKATVRFNYIFAIIM